MKKINVTEELHSQIGLICFVNGVSQTQFIKKVVEDFVKRNPIPNKFKVNKKFQLEQITE